MARVEYFTAALPQVFAQNRNIDPNNPLGIERFKGVLNKYGIQPTNLFRVSIAMPKVFGNLSYFYNSQVNLPVGGLESATKEILGFYCTDINLPGISMASTEVRRYGVGPIQRVPYSPIFADTTFTFLADGRGVIHTFFMEWMRRMINYTRSGNTLQAQLQYGEPYEVEYKSNYQSPGIQIEVFDKTGKRIQVIVMYDAYPLNIGEVMMSYANTDEIARIPVTFTFRDFEIVESALEPSPLIGGVFNTASDAVYQAGSEVGAAIVNAAKGLFNR